MRVVVDLERCAGYANCVVAAPDVFDVGDADNLVTLRMEHPPEEFRDAVERAVEDCPARAIALESD